MISQLPFDQGFIESDGEANFIKYSCLQKLGVWINAILMPYYVLVQFAHCNILERHSIQSHLCGIDWFIQRDGETSFYDIK